MSSGLDHLRVEDDGLPRGEVNRWAEDKYRLLSLYSELFSSGMKNKWEQRVYIDLYAGAGYSHIQGTQMFLKGSPIIALTVSTPSTGTYSARKARNYWVRSRRVWSVSRRKRT